VRFVEDDDAEGFEKRIVIKTMLPQLAGRPDLVEMFINEATLAFVPKVLALCVALMLLGPFMLSTLSGYTLTLFDRMVAIGGS